MAKFDNVDLGTDKTMRRMVKQEQDNGWAAQMTTMRQPINWRKRKRLWKRRILWANGSNKSVHTFCRINCFENPKWKTIRWYMRGSDHAMGHIANR